MINELCEVKQYILNEVPSGLYIFSCVKRKLTISFYQREGKSLEVLPQIERARERKFGFDHGHTDRQTQHKSTL